MRRPLIRIENLWRVYTNGAVEVPALRGVSIVIEQGEFVAVMGASGSGKSTFLNILGFLDRPTRGRYLFRGRDVTALSADERAEIRNREIGFVFQSFNLLPRATVVENVELPLFYGPLPYAEQRPRALAALAALGLSDRAFSYPNQLSGGQQQRVAIARALVTEPSLLLADEPTGNLDSVAGKELMELLVRLNVQQGLTVVLVTHEPDIAAYAQRVVHFRDGLIVSDQPRGVHP
ncbi:putative ABC transporter ATP-binding protein YknY [bacterium HR30]|nr:putative ABC transporter ATP-binding protein YknY [bacterium HR30]